MACTTSLWPSHIKSRSFRDSVDFAPLRGHSVTVNYPHSRNTKGTEVVSVPRREGPSGSSESVAQQSADEMMILHEVSTEVGSVLRSLLRARSTSCVSRTVLSRKRELRTSEWRKRVVRSGCAYPPASPKDTLASVFERMRRAARAKKSQRITERLAPLLPRPGASYCVSVKSNL